MIESIALCRDVLLAERFTEMDSLRINRLSTYTARSEGVRNGRILWMGRFLHNYVHTQP